VPVSVEEDRRHLVEAAIVRVMKARKVREHKIKCTAISFPTHFDAYILSFVFTPHTPKIYIDAIAQRVDSRGYEAARAPLRAAACVHQEAHRKSN